MQQRKEKILNELLQIYSTGINTTVRVSSSTRKKLGILLHVEEFLDKTKVGMKYSRFGQTMTYVSSFTCSLHLLSKIATWLSQISNFAINVIMT